MQPDNLYPNQGESLNYYDQPTERLQEEADERNILGASYPVLPKIAEWFKDQIALCDSIDNIDMTSTLDVASQILAYKELKRLLEEKYNEFQDFGE